MIKIGRPNLLETGFGAAVGLVTLLSCQALFRAPLEGARTRDLKVQATSIAAAAGSRGGLPVGEPVCGTTATQAAGAAKIQLLKVTKLVGATVTDLSVGRYAPAAGGVISQLPVTFHLAISPVGFPAFLEAMSHGKTGLFLDDVDLAPAKQNSLDVRVQGRVICDAQATQ